MSTVMRQSNSHHRWLIISLCIGLVAIVAGGAAIMHSRAVTANAALAKHPLSRQVVEYQETLIKQLRPPPTLAALQYAYVSSAYSDALSVGGQAGGLQAARSLLQVLYPDQMTTINRSMTQLATQNHVATTATGVSVQRVISGYQQRYQRDGHDLAWDGVVPIGPGKWVQLTAKAPFTPRAGEWQRWNVTSAIAVPPPPVLGSPEDQKQVVIVKQAVATRSGQDVNTINFWGGTPGSETPAGIWQNQLYRTVQGDLPSSIVTADQAYALTQKTLAQTLSDAFMECWKVKYQYWTARPSMRIHGLSTAMDDPNFPGYISGHSTISKAAADVLSVQVPKYQSAWQAMAVEARNSRLVAGIHFDVDNAVGFTVGDAVAAQTISNDRLQREL